MAGPEPPPGPDPRRVLQERRLDPRPGTPPTPPEGGGDSRRPSLAVIVLAGIALGLGVATAVLVASGPEEKFITTTAIKRVKPTTTTTNTDTTVLTTVVNTTTPAPPGQGNQGQGGG